RPQLPQQATQHQHGEATAVHVARPEHGGDQVPRIAIEDEQRMVHVLAVGAMVLDPLLLAMGRVGGPGQVHKDAGGDPRTATHPASAAHTPSAASASTTHGSPPSLLTCPPSKRTPRLMSSCQNRKPTPDPVAVAH